jgi:hypothetical protein
VCDTTLRGCCRDDGPANGLNGPLHGSPSPEKSLLFPFLFHF